MQRKMHFEQGKNYLWDSARKAHVLIKQKLDDHFLKVRHAIDEVEEDMQRQFKTIMADEKHQIRLLAEKVDEWIEMLNINELSLSSLESYDDTELLYMTKVIEEASENV